MRVCLTELPHIDRSHPALLLSRGWNSVRLAPFGQRERDLTAQTRDALSDARLAHRDTLGRARLGRVLLCGDKLSAAEPVHALGLLLPRRLLLPLRRPADWSLLLLAR